MNSNGRDKKLAKQKSTHLKMFKYTSKENCKIYDNCNDIILVS